MNEEAIKKIVRDEIQALFGNEKYIFNRSIQMLDGRNILLGKTTGTEIGTATDEKLAFHGSTAVIQRASADQASISNPGFSGADTVDRNTLNTIINNIVTLSNEIRTVLVEKGVMKGSA